MFYLKKFDYEKLEKCKEAVAFIEDEIKYIKQLIDDAELLAMYGNNISDIVIEILKRIVSVEVYLRVRCFRLDLES